MAFFRGVSTTPVSTGSTSLTGFGFQPNEVEIELCQKTSTAEAFVHYSSGSADGTRQGCVSIYSDATSSQSKESNAKIISHWNRVTGTLTEVIAATFTSFDADGVTLNFSATITGYHMHIRARS